MQSILLTGGAGYIGSSLTPALLERGYKVDVLDLFENQTSIIECCGFPEFTPIKGDVLDIERYVDVEKYDYILPLAGVVGAPKCSRQPTLAQEINITALVKMLRLMTPKKQNIIFPSSNSVYGKQSEICTEETLPAPISIYGEHKLEGENLIREFIPKNYVILRKATVFGVSNTMRFNLLVNDFVRKAFQEKHITLYEANYMRSLIHISDVVNAYLHTLQNFEAMKGNIYNVASSSLNLTKRAIIDSIKKHGLNFTILDDRKTKDLDQRNYEVCTKKIEKTGLKSNVSLEEGVREVLKLLSILS